MMENFSYLSAMNHISEQELELFRDYLRRLCGVEVPREKAYLFETRLAKMLADANAETFTELYNYIQSGADPNAGQKIINAMVTNETLWFRDGAPWELLESELLPRLKRQLESGEKTKARIWCAAVSTGQEAYSAAMCVDDYLSKAGGGRASPRDFEIFATDISSRVLDIAKRGRYDAVSIMRGLSDYYRNKYFTRDASAWELSEKIQKAVNFAQFNLKDSYGAFGRFDIILLRYVLIYFSPGTKREIIAKMHGALNDGGVLVTGNTALGDYFEEYFDTNHFGSMAYYTKKAVEK